MYQHYYNIIKLKLNPPQVSNSSFILIRNLTALNVVNIPFTALRYFKTFEKVLIMDMNG